VSEAIETSTNPPFLRVVRGDATEEEVAALVAVIGSLGGSTPAKKPVPAWSSHHRKVRVTLPHGPGGWRNSALPH